ncbi:hypothetical protein GYB59_00715 [bacterium]|nr:hypothetical protein [bacterium]
MANENSLEQALRKQMDANQQSRRRQGGRLARLQAALSGETYEQFRHVLRELSKLDTESGLEDGDDPPLGEDGPTETVAGSDRRPEPGR